jgi:hypothetical protein
MVAAAIWSSGLLWSGRILDATLRRFHLTTASYAAWMLQQPVPAMYNFANESAQVTRDIGWDALDPKQRGVLREAVNHFPPRTVTFAPSLPFLPTTTTGIWTSRFRGRMLETWCRIEPLPGGGLRLRPVSERWNGIERRF